jgi:hypothetical protein
MRRKLRDVDWGKLRHTLSLMPFSLSSSCLKRNISVCSGRGCRHSALGASTSGLPVEPAIFEGLVNNYEKENEEMVCIMGMSYDIRERAKLAQTVRPAGVLPRTRPALSRPDEESSLHLPRSRLLLGIYSQRHWGSSSHTCGIDSQSSCIGVVGGLMVARTRLISKHRISNTASEFSRL